jgi:uncharacterized protein (TIGR02757 family)
VSALKKKLDRFYREFDFQNRIKHDPIAIPRRFSRPEDIEIAAFIASSFAYGKVDLFRPVIESILRSCGKRPAEFLVNFSLKKEKKYFEGLYYRFNKEKDILCFIYLITKALKEYGTMKDLFNHSYKPEDDDIRNGLEGVTDIFSTVDTTPVYGRNLRPSGLRQLLPSPRTGSACKRMNLFLRWMVRKKDIDFGVWDNIPPSKLIIPLDTHIARISRCLGLTERKSSNWKTAREITTSLKKLDPQDPLKYDFALCHQGISGLCKGERAPSVCRNCSLISA